jgi:hypothetical protein
MNTFRRILRVYDDLVAVAAAFAVTAITIGPDGWLPAFLVGLVLAVVL